MSVTLLLMVLAGSRLPTPADPAAQAEVAKLSHPRFAVRELACKRLIDMGAGARADLRAASKSSDPETSQRANTCLAAIAGNEIDALRPFPEIDAYWRDADLHCYRYNRAPEPMLRALSAVGGGDARPYTHYYAATEVWVRERLEAGVNPSFLRLVLADMHRRDADFLERMDHPETGPFPIDPDAYLRGFAK